MNQEGGNSMNNNNADTGSPQTDAPEKELTYLAVRLALLEKMAAVFGTLGFIWATVVLLGGFAITLDTTDFWFITVILVIEGARIFSRSHELEFQHQATWSWSTADGSPTTVGRARSNDEENQIPTGLSSFDTISAFLTPTIRKLLYWSQLFSAATCVALSLIKLIKHDFGQIQKGDTDKRNRKAALYIFYSLALAEASLFLLERTYLVWKADYLKLLEKVNYAYGLGAAGMVFTKRFFYDAYSKSVNGSVFDGLKTDMLSFAVELLTSTSPDEQLIGATLLQKLATKDKFSTATLRKIGVDIDVIERLIEMLNWRNPNEKQIRQSAAEILVEVASRKQNSLRIAEIPGAVESVASLLRTSRSSYTDAGDEICQRGAMTFQETTDMQTFNLLGLKILNELSRDHENCGKIGNTRGLLPKIIDFTHTTQDMLTNEAVPPSHITIVEQSLALVKMLVSTIGVTGSNLRKEISELVFTISNVRNILKNGERHPDLQLLGIEVLTSLGLEDDATEKIGGTGGVLKELLNIFFRQAAPGQQERLRDAAGNAIAMLTLESKSNCHRFLQLQAMDRLVEAVKNEALCTNTARILMNLCAYTNDTSFDNTLHRVVVTAPTVLKAVMEASDKQQEMMTGLAFNVLHYKVCTLEGMLHENKHKALDLARALVRILKKQSTPSIRVPRMRRFAIELAIWMMRDSGENVDTFRRLFRELRMDIELAGVMETATEIENFHLFSGTVGVSRYAQSLHSLADTALSLLAATSIVNSRSV